MTPAHFAWGFGGREGLPPAEARSCDFQFTFHPSVERRPVVFREAVRKAVEGLDRARAGRPIALCHDGGMGSEILARELRQLGIDFEMFFLDLWGLNYVLHDELAQPFAKEMGRPLHVVNLDLLRFEEYSEKVFLEFGFEAPAYLALTYLFEQIPPEYFILAGEGGFDRRAPIYAEIARRASVPVSPGTYIPFAGAQAFYYSWAKKRNRLGEFSFYLSTPELAASVLLSPQVKVFPESNVREALYAEFPGLKPRPRSTMWLEKIGPTENREIRRRLRKEVVEKRGWDFWRDSAGTMVRAEDIFLGR